MCLIKTWATLLKKSNLLFINFRQAYILFIFTSSYLYLLHIYFNFTLSCVSSFYLSLFYIFYLLLLLFLFFFDLFYLIFNFFDLILFLSFLLLLFHFTSFLISFNFTFLSFLFFFALKYLLKILCWFYFSYLWIYKLIVLRNIIINICLKIIKISKKNDILLSCIRFCHQLCLHSFHTEKLALKIL